jgi:sec-independent protein translocase protein TatC
MIYIFLQEIRNRCFLIILTWFLTFLTCYLNKEIILFKLISPYVNFFKQNAFYFIYTNISEIFSTYIYLCSFISNQIVLILIIYHLIIFLVPGLYKFESKNLKFTAFLNLIGWSCALLLLHSILLPLSGVFFVKFQNSLTYYSPKFYFEAKVNEYLNFYIRVYFLYCLNFQFLFGISVFSRYILKNIQITRILRKNFYFIFCIIATLTTPPDILSQLIVCSTLIGFYELSIFSSILKIKN